MKDLNICEIDLLPHIQQVTKLIVGQALLPVRIGRGKVALDRQECLSYTVQFARPTVRC
jgi:hypothetical protein